MTTSINNEYCPIRGWTWRPSEACEALWSWSDVEAAWSQPDSRLWIDLERPSRNDIVKLDSMIDLDDAAMEDCLDGPERPRIDEYDNHFALFLYGVLSPDESGRFSPRRVIAFCSERFLVTVHAEAMLSIKSLYERCERHGTAILGHGIDLLLYRFVDTLVDNYLSLLDQFDEDLDQLEADSFGARATDSFLMDIARLRNELMEVRRLASAQQSLLAPLARGEFNYVSDNLSSEFRHVEEHLAHTLDRAEGMRERLSGALQNYHSILTQRTNDIVRLLTVFAAILLPLSLIAGIYGMNVPIWPPGDRPQSFWVVLAAMGCVGGGLLWFFRTRKWF